jgi:ATP/maltotriose-dependent transcriptional regulator MalT
LFRAHLFQLLNEGLDPNASLAWVSAPVGIGRTTLVVTWLEQIDRPAAWLSPYEADNDLPCFLAYLAAAFSR